MYNRFHSPFKVEIVTFHHLETLEHSRMVNKSEVKYF